MVDAGMIPVDDDHKQPIDHHHNMESKGIATVKVQILHPKYPHQHNQIYQIHIEIDIAIIIIRIPSQHSPIEKSLHES